MRLMLHDNSLNVRGTATSTYDYAFTLKSKFNYECIIAYDLNQELNDSRIVDKFKKQFDVYGYKDFKEIENVITHERVDAFYAIKAGGFDEKISKNVPNLIHAVFPIGDISAVHGDRYAFVSEWLTNEFKNRQNIEIPFVPHMINLPNVDENYKNKLKIKDDEIVIGRYGGYDSFDIPFVKNAINTVLQNRNNIVFLFCNTPKFIEHPRVIFTNSLASLSEKVKFLKTCDAFLHARGRGETFGLSILEAMSVGLPVLTYGLSPERNHINLLKDKGLYYNTHDDLINYLLQIKKNKIVYDNVKDYYPEQVIQKFLKVFLK